MNKAVLAIRGILVRIRTSDYRIRASDYRIRASDYRIRLRIQLRIRLLSSVTLGMQFIITYQQAHYLQSSKFSSLLKFCVKTSHVFCKHYFSSLNTYGRIRIRTYD
jgi:hypothetical protein